MAVRRNAKLVAITIGGHSCPRELADLPGFKVTLIGLAPAGVQIRGGSAPKAEPQVVPLTAVSDHVAPRRRAAMVEADRRARYSVGATFALNGLTFANLVPRYPEIVAEIGLDNVSFGTAVAAWPLGALLSVC